MNNRDTLLAHMDTAAKRLDDVTTLLHELGRGHRAFVDEVRSLYKIRADLYQLEHRLCSLPNERFDGKKP